MTKKATTLMELVIVIVIITIIASMGFSYFVKNREVTLGKGAMANLRIIAAAERIYRAEVGSFWPIDTSTTNINDINSYLRVRLNNEDFNYTISASGGTSFNATADRESTGGTVGCSNCYDCNYSINQTVANVVPNPSCPKF